MTASLFRRRYANINCEPVSAGVSQKGVFMMSTGKKGLLVLILLAVVTGGAFAEWYNSYAPGLEDDFLFINAGIGFGPTGGYNMGFPPISASFDFKLPVNVPITVGPMVAFTSWKYSWPGFSVVYRNIGFGVRGMYHFNFAKNLDTYAGLTLGYVFQSAKVSSSGYWSWGRYDASSSFFLWGINIGARYFFTDVVGAYLELGYSPIQIIGIGVSIKI